MITISNSLTFVRAPLALLFLQENSSLRILAVILAMITDSIDGYVARRRQSASRFGAILDPVMDKFFVYFALTVLVSESKLSSWEAVMMLSRDFFLFLYTLLVLAAGRWKTMVFRSIRWGKATTALQFIVLIGLLMGISFPWYLFVAFIIMGFLAFLELFQARTQVT